MMASTELDIALQKVIAVTAAHAHDVRAAVPLVPTKYTKAGPGTRALYLELSTLIANLDLTGAGADLATLKPVALMKAIGEVQGTLAAVEHGLCAPEARPLHKKGLRFARLVPAKLRGDDKAADKRMNLLAVRVAATLRAVGAAIDEATASSHARKKAAYHARRVNHKVWTGLVQTIEARERLDSLNHITKEERARMSTFEFAREPLKKSLSSASGHSDLVGEEVGLAFLTLDPGLEGERRLTGTWSGETLVEAGLAVGWAM